MDYGAKDRERMKLEGSEGEESVSPSPDPQFQNPKIANVHRCYDVIILADSCIH